jgi:tRNA pseudouridine55 synthase
VHGILVVDKPAGPTSHDVVDRVRREAQTRRVGHTGTLDPFASGVLPVCIGKATRLARFFSGHDKAYRAEMRLGFATTTDDMKGEPLGPSRPVAIEREAVAAAARTFLGEILQVPPAFSAKRTAGRRHYELARAGEVVERRACAVVIHAIDVRAVDGDRVEMDVECGAGTYIRALARDLGERLGTGAHLVGLRRTRSGPFRLDDAVPLDSLGQDALEPRVLTMDRLLTELPAVEVGEDGLRALRHGRDLTKRLVLSGFPEAPPERMRVLGPSGALLALAVPRGFAPSVPGLTVEPVLHPDLVLID